MHGTVPCGGTAAERRVARRHAVEPLEQPPVVGVQPRGHRVGHRLDPVQQRRDGRIGQRSHGGGERRVVARPIVNVPADQAVGLRNWFATRVMLASKVIPDLKPTFFGVLQLVVPAERLMRPRVVMTALLHGRRLTGQNRPASFIRRGSQRIRRS
jgi:hypothetical protein